MPRQSRQPRKARQATRDPREAPSALDGLQAWFGRAISTPLPGTYAGNPLSVSAPETAAGAEARLRGTGAFGGFARLGVYNEQYWFRLVSIMQADYACVIHLMGLKRFNDWAVRYLLAHPPASPFLADLDAGFPAFLAAGYDGPAREETVQAAAYERALSRAFDAPAGRPLSEAGAGLMAARLALAPHASPLHLDWDFAAYRARCLPDESLEAAVEPPLPASADLVIYRDGDLQVRGAAIPAPALALLRAFPGTLPETFARLEGALAPEGQALLERELTGWFRDWAAAGWLCLEEPAGEGGAETERDPVP